MRVVPALASGLARLGGDQGGKTTSSSAFCGVELWYNKACRQVITLKMCRRDLGDLRAGGGASF